MQRWLASQAKYPKAVVVVAVAFIVGGTGSIASGNAAENPFTGGYVAVLLGIYLLACAVARLREQQSEPPSAPPEF
jgi:hypothetical protein